MPHEEREREFLIAALCFCTKALPIEALTFPGLAAWKIRHDVIDLTGADDSISGYHAPMFMDEFMRAFPK
jgi:hypothetical protein